MGASMDMGVSHTLSRHFFWNENVLWKKDMQGRRVTVSLGGKDLIVNTEAVGRYLSEETKVGTMLPSQARLRTRRRMRANTKKTLLKKSGKVDHGKELVSMYCGSRI